MQIVSQLVFAVVLGVAVYLFYRQVSKIRRNILLGKPENRNDHKKERLITMLRVAFGQTKMVRRPIPALLHFFVYIGFILINIEVLEIIIDGLAGTHRIFMKPLGVVYNVAIGFFEILGVLVLVSCVIFLIRRFALKVPRLNMAELKGWPMKDAANILIIEIVLMAAILVMNAADRPFQEAANMPVSSLIAPLFAGMSDASLHTLERVAWWAHIIGILAFLNYLPFSKHWHIIMAFPNTYYSNLKPKGEFANSPAITTEVKLAMDFSATPPEGYQPPTSFGVKDVTDLGWKNLMDAYSCTECGRCTAVCPANITGKKLSPRKIMMDTRDRLEEVGKNMDANNGQFAEDGKNLHSYISAEELWACTTCNACVQSCPVNINPLEIIYNMRQYLVMEQSSAPAELNGMFTNLENNGAPWQFPASDRGNWANQL